MIENDAVKYFSYPDPMLMPETSRVIDVVYEINANELEEVPDFSQFFPPKRQEDKKKAEMTDDTGGIRQLEALRASGLSELDLEKLREKLREGFSAVIDEVFASLTTDAKAIVAPQLLNQEMNLLSLMAASRCGESMSRRGRQLAEEIVIGSVVNWGNEVWDPNDPQTSNATENNFLLALLQY